MESKEILAHADDISLERAATADHSKFCDIWPTVKDGLNILVTFIKNPALKAIITSIIAAGDAVIGRICG